MYVQWYIQYQQELIIINFWYQFSHIVKKLRTFNQLISVINNYIMISMCNHVDHLMCWKKSKYAVETQWWDNIDGMTEIVHLETLGLAKP